MITGGIFGPKLSGKTTLAKQLSLQFWQKRQMRSLVLDPYCETYGEHAFVTEKEKLFWENVWKTTNCFVVVDEAASTIKRDKDLIPAFTQLRHNQHVFVVIGHTGMSLLPVMREQIDTVYLFRQPESAAKIWAETMTEKGLFETVELMQFEFIYHRMYQKPQRMKLSLPKK